ncbi:MAG: hypothetical protein F6J97_20760 [Leptolyngbya sp. SIO4C1]|nr:hypothetical protein [Leptolyngbya sp. SIO4C1]
MSVLSSAVLSGVGVVAVLIGYGALKKEHAAAHGTLKRPQTASASKTAANMTDTAQAAIRDLEARMDALARDRGTLEQQYQAAEATSQTLQQQVDVLMQERTDLQQQLNQAQANAAESASEPDAELSAQVADLTQEAQALEALLERRETAIAALQDTLAEREAAIADLQQQVSELSAALEAAPAEQPAAEPAEPAEAEPDEAEPANASAKTLLPKPTAESSQAEESREANGKSQTGRTANHQPDEYDAEAAKDIAAAIDDRSLSAEFGSLQGKSIVMTGLLLQLTPAILKERLQAVGGRLQGNPNSKTDYILVGENPGGKLQRAERLNIPRLSEEQLLELLEEAEVAVREAG